MRNRKWQNFTFFWGKISILHQQQPNASTKFKFCWCKCINQMFLQNSSIWFMCVAHIVQNLQSKELPIKKGCFLIGNKHNSCDPVWQECFDDSRCERFCFLFETTEVWILQKWNLIYFKKYSCWLFRSKRCYCLRHKK